MPRFHEQESNEERKYHRKIYGTVQIGLRKNTLYLQNIIVKLNIKELLNKREQNFEKIENCLEVF